MTWRFVFFFGSAIGVLLLGGCEADGPKAFPTAQTLARSGATHETDVQTLSLGRKIFTTGCTECHVARPIAGYSVERWHYYIGIMAPRARLAPEERAALEAYVIAARASLPPGQGNGSSPHH